MSARDQFVEAIQAAHAAGGAEAVREGLAQHLADWDGPPDWMGPLNAGDFSVIHRDPTLTIMNIIWPPGIITEPHNHNAWAVIGIYQGREDNLLWQRTETGIAPAGASGSGSDLIGLWYASPPDSGLSPDARRHGLPRAPWHTHCGGYGWHGCIRPACGWLRPDCQTAPRGQS